MNRKQFLSSTIAPHYFLRFGILALFLLVPFMPLSFAHATHATQHTPDFDAIDAYVDTQMREQHIPGLALGIVHGDQIVHLKGFGLATPNGEAVTAKTSFSIGSLTKSFTAVAIMQLVENKKLELDAPVQRYIPWFRVADQDASARITLRNLLNHASGLPRDFSEPDEEAKPLNVRLRSLSSTKLKQPIGTYGYSNVGYQVLAMVIQQVTGQSYEDYIRQNIFAPLDMKNSFATVLEAPQYQTAAGYHYWFGLPVASGTPSYQTGPGNGGLFASAEDMSHYLVAHLNHGRYGQATLLSPAGIDEVHRPAVPIPDGDYAMGWGVRKVNGVTFLSHSGQTYNYTAKMILIPDGAWGIVVLENSQYMLKFLVDDMSQIAFVDGVADMLIDRQPTSPEAPSDLWFVYGILIVIAIVQLAGMLRLWIILRRWQQAEHRPQRKREIIWQCVIPLILNFIWGLLTLGLFLADDITKLIYQMPDFISTLLLSGFIAFGWGVISTIKAYKILRQSDGNSQP